MQTCYKTTTTTLTFKSGDPNFSRPRMVKLGGDRITLLGLTNLEATATMNDGTRVELVVGGRVGTLAGCNRSRMLFGESRKSSPACSNDLVLDSISNFSHSMIVWTKSLLLCLKRQKPCLALRISTAGKGCTHNRAPPGKGTSGRSWKLRGNFFMSLTLSISVDRLPVQELRPLRRSGVGVRPCRTRSGARGCFACFSSLFADAWLVAGVFLAKTTACAKFVLTRRTYFTQYEPLSPCVRLFGHGGTVVYLLLMTATRQPNLHYVGV